MLNSLNIKKDTVTSKYLQKRKERLPKNFKKKLNTKVKLT